MNKLSLGKCLFLDVLSTPLSWTFYFYSNKSLQDGYEVLELLCLGKETCLGTLPRPSLARLMAICGDTASIDDNFQRRKQMNSVSVLLNRHIQHTLSIVSLPFRSVYNYKLYLGITEPASITNPTAFS